MVHLSLPGLQKPHYWVPKTTLGAPSVLRNNVAKGRTRATYGSTRHSCEVKGHLKALPCRRSPKQYGFIRFPLVKLTSVVVTCLVLSPFGRLYCCKNRTVGRSRRHLVDFVAIAGDANPSRFCSKFAMCGLATCTCVRFLLRCVHHPLKSIEVAV